MPSDPHKLCVGHPALILEQQLALYRELHELARAQARAAQVPDMDAVEACLLRRNAVIRDITANAAEIRNRGFSQNPTPGSGEAVEVGEIRRLAQAVETEDAKAREALEHHRDESAKQLAELRRQVRAGTGYAGVTSSAPRFQDREI